jgi:hypothetical protein
MSSGPIRASPYAPSMMTPSPAASIVSSLAYGVSATGDRYTLSRRTTM